MAQHYLRADAGGVKQNVRERYLNYAELAEAAAPSQRQMCVQTCLRTVLNDEKTRRKRPITKGTNYS